MDTRQDHSEHARIPDRMNNSNAPLLLSEVLRTTLELPFWMFLFTVKTLQDSPVVQQCSNVFIDFIIHIIKRIVQDPIIQETISTTISEGINRFVQQPDLDQLLLHMVTSISKSQPDIARQQGQDFPIVVSSFVQGILQHAVNRKSPQKINHNDNNKNGSHIQAENESQQMKPLQLSFEQSRTEAVECSIENTNCLNTEPGHVVADSSMDESLVTITVPTSPIDEDEAFNDDVIVCTSNSTASMITVTATAPTNQNVHSEEHDVVQASPSSQVNVDESSNKPSQIEKSSLDCNDTLVTTSAGLNDDTISDDNSKVIRQQEILDAQKHKHNGRWW